MKKEIYLLLLTFIITAASMANDDKAASDILDPSYSQALNATFRNNTAEISWLAKPNSNVRRYELQKSNDGNTFSYITAVASNMSSGSKKITAIDRNVDEGINYYRVKTIFNDGSFVYKSNTAIIQNVQSFSPAILPQVAEENLYVWLPSNNSIAQITIYDAAGRAVLHNPSTTLNANLASIYVDKLSQGAYSVSFETGKQHFVHLKFAKK